jgi:hypothetical protein
MVMKPCMKKNYESEPEPVSAIEEAELVSRTSVDSVAEEVRMTLRNQTTSPVVQAPTLSPEPARSQQSCMSENTFGTRFSSIGRTPRNTLS